MFLSCLLRKILKISDKGWAIDTKSVLPKCDGYTVYFIYFSLDN